MNEKVPKEQQNHKANPIERLRERLLDLSARNKLLNFNHRATHVRVVDEIPDQFYELLVLGDELTFLPVPQPTRDQLIEHGYLTIDPVTGAETKNGYPTATEWAERLGFDTRYELPTAGSEIHQKHQDTGIQTLFFPEALSARLRDVYKKAKTFEEGTGTNILYLVFGFLEWYESADSDKSRLAPLHLIPVRLNEGRLDKKTNTFSYTVNFTDEDILPNLSLREKLKNDFGLNLPELNEETKPEEYFTEIRKMIKNPQPRWKVHRNCTLGLLHFGKLLLYLDLDSRKWPEGKNILEHTIVSNLLGVQKDETAENDLFSEEYEIDEIQDIHYQYPLMDDADSSQHSVLIDALQNVNLVVEGPPGTGKSQTISNLIAAAIAQGKKVLFVTEKLVALEVVKRRLDKAGLGDFCLELHSHKTQKSKVLQDINDRMENQSKYKKPEDIEQEIKRYERHKDELKEYAKIISEKWLSTSKSIHQVLTGAVRYRNELSEFDISNLKINKLKSEQLTTELQNKLEELIYEYKELYLKVIHQKKSASEFGVHPWHGINNVEIQLYDVNDVCERIKAVQASIKDINTTTTMIEFSKILLQAGESHSDNNIELLRSLLPDLGLIPVIDNDFSLNPIPLLKNELLAEFKSYLELHGQIQELFAKLAVNGNIDVSSNSLPVAGEVQLVLNDAESFPVKGAITLLEMKEVLATAEELFDQLRRIEPMILSLKERCGLAADTLFCASDSGISELLHFIDLCCALDLSLWGKRNPCLEKHEVDDVIASLQLSINSVKHKANHLRDTFDLARLPNYNEIQHIRGNLSVSWVLGVFKKDWWSSRKRLKSLAKNPSSKFADLFDHIVMLCDYIQELEELESNSVNHDVLNGLYHGANTDIAAIKLLRDWYKTVKASYGLSIDNNNALLKNIILTITPEVAQDIHGLKENGGYECLTTITNHLSKIKSIFDDAKIKKLDFIAGRADSFLSKWCTDFKRIDGYFELHFKKHDVSYSDSISMLHNLCDLSEKLDVFNKVDVSRFVPLGSVSLAIGCNVNDEQNNVFSKIYDISSAIQGIDNSHIKNYIYLNPNLVSINSLKVCGIELANNLKKFDDAVNTLVELTGLNLDQWTSGNPNLLDKIYSRNEFAIDNAGELIHWLDYLRIQKELHEQGFDTLVVCIENGVVPIDKITIAYNFMIFDLLSREVYASHKGLKRYFPKNLEALRSLFRECDTKIKKLQCKYIAALAAQNDVPYGTTGKADDFTDRCLLKRECGKKKRHIPLRKLVLKAKDALLALKPCFMMGPLAVAQYLPPGLIEFDLIIMDEASQIKPEDALGAIARAKQAIIIGDPNQLPPTNFFDSVMDDVDSSEDTILTDSESILDAAMPVFKKRRLRWHYRSQHESLIAFSNHNFYSRDLVVFPSPHHSSDTYGVKLIQIDNAKFSDNCNQEEAAAIALAVKRHLLDHPEESLGVVAMNIHQTDLIDKLLEQLRKDDPLLQSAYENSLNNDEPMFIKNLENVQGDERDVIFISTTYGPCEYGGKTFQRFGPINGDAGWRRLNVLFTRSKKRMHVFTSMKPEDITPTDSSSRGMHALKDFLAYAKSGIIDQPRVTGKEPDSDFEIAVANALYQAGFEVDYQVGLAGFNIDIAVKHPSRPGSYIMGIECDGAAYHSAKSARDRDRLRQEILEIKGWRIRRIWSTDWFKDYKAVLKPIIDELHRISSVDANE